MSTKGQDWKFYGRKEQLSHITDVLSRNRWFFMKITGRRRIGKTALINEAIRQLNCKRQVFYMQIPDSGDVGILSSFCDALNTFAIPCDLIPRPQNLSDLVKTLESLIRGGYVIVLDEFQYLNRKHFAGFCSLLQHMVDNLSQNVAAVRGGLIVSGSIHTEMTALLEDRHSPLYNRVTDSLELTHLDISSILEILGDHADDSPERLLFLWSLFEGIPKFYRDCFEQGVLMADRKEILRKIFFESSSPLRSEAESWFLHELKGKYDSVLKFVARNPGRPHKDLVEAIQQYDGDASTQVGGYLKILTERYQLIERRMPIFAKPEARKGRYYLSDNFLQSWLGSLSGPVAARDFRPKEDLLSETDASLETVEGHSLEKLAGKLYEERSRKGIGDFPLTHRIQGYWDKHGTEIDIVVVHEKNKRLRFGSCKRSPSKLISDLPNIKSHVSRFLNVFQKYSQDGWEIDIVGIAPRLEQKHRVILERYDVIPQDLRDLMREL